MLARKGPEQCSLHDPVQMAQPVDVPCQLVVLHDPSVLHPEPGNDVEVAAMCQDEAWDRLPCNPVTVHHLLQHVPWEPEFDLPVDRTARGTIHHADLVPEE